MQTGFPILLRYYANTSDLLLGYNHALNSEKTAKDHMKEYKPIRTALFVPGNRPDRVDKAFNSNADAIIIDLEDAVPRAEKEKTRAVVKEKILQYKEKNVIVRVNSSASGFMEGDLNEVAGKGLLCIMVPKVESISDIQKTDSLLDKAEKQNQINPGTILMMPLIETALGVQNIFQILSEKTKQKRLYMIAFGAADYTLDMGIEMTKDGNELFYARSKIAVACRAAGAMPPLDSPYMIDLKDEKGLAADAKKAKQLGFQGKLCIHPNQIDICNKIFSPTDDELQYAEKVINAFNTAESKGVGAIQLDGKFIDYPVVEKSRRILKLAENMSCKI